MKRWRDRPSYRDAVTHLLREIYSSLPQPKNNYKRYSHMRILFCHLQFYIHLFFFMFSLLCRPLPIWLADVIAIPRLTSCHLPFLSALSIVLSGRQNVLSFAFPISPPPNSFSSLNSILFDFLPPLYSFSSPNFISFNFRPFLYFFSSPNGISFYLFLSH